MCSDESPVAMFQRTLKVSSQLAQAIFSGGLTSIEEVAYVPWTELAEITELSGDELNELRRIARLYLLNQELGDAFDD
jgi:transcription termination/antitermination protein NusA